MEYHVSVEGNDANDGAAGTPLETVSAAAREARPGDVITVHEGTYRERIDPPRGGAGDDERIVYRAAEGESVTLTGSEVVSGWSSAGGDIWSVTLPAGFFGDFNPFDDLIRGDWFADHGRDHHRGDVFVNGASLREAESLEKLRESGDDARVWYAEVDGGETTVWARFGGVDPAEATVEITARPAVFYPSEPGRDYITVRGFEMQHAATQWAPPTTEQIGLLGTHWSHGWVIEDNEISHSRCVGVTLGKYGASVDDTGASASRYNDTIRDALDNGWQKGTVGGHVVRNNVVHRCEQAGIVGSMGGAFSEIVGNHVYDINVEGQFGGAEIAGLKLHGPIDTEIRRNRIHNARRGIWLDWMTQGTRVTRNLLYDNDSDDLFFEVDHGPYVVDNNISLSEVAVSNWSQGGAFVHNLFRGQITQRQVLDRSTPFHEPHSTEIRGMSNITGGDDRFYNNVFTSKTHIDYDETEYSLRYADNEYLRTPSHEEINPFDVDDRDSAVELVDPDDGVVLRVRDNWSDESDRELVTTELLGDAVVPDLPYENPDGSSLSVDTDYFGAKRDASSPRTGPFAGDPLDGDGSVDVEVWPN